MDYMEDVLDNYIVWEFCNKRDIRDAIIEGSADGTELKEEIVDEVRTEYQEKGYNHDEKIHQVMKLDSNPVHRCKMFQYCSWTKETVKIEDLGTTLPNAMGLPPEIISGSLNEVIQFVQEADQDEYQSVEYIMSLKKVPEVLKEFQATVISPGSIIRRQERIRKAHGDKDWGIKDTWGAVHDGNHRLIAKILAHDLEEIECFVGRPRSDEIYEHVELDE